MAYEDKMSGILSGKKIVEEIENGRIKIDPFDNKYVNPISVDLTLGDQVAVYEDWVETWEYIADQDGRFLTPKEFGLSVKNEPSIKTFKINPDRGWFLKPGIGYLMHTNERVATDYYVPVIDGKSSVGRLFIQVHATAGIGDPGFDGQYTLEVIVQHPIRVFPGMRIAQVRFFEISGGVTNYRETGNYKNELAIGPVPSRLWKSFG